MSLFPYKLDLGAIWYIHFSLNLCYTNFKHSDWLFKKFQPISVIKINTEYFREQSCRASEHQNDSPKKLCHLLIADHLDTTANHTLAAYDRIIFYGDNLIKLVIDGLAKPFRYDQHRDFQNVNQGELTHVDDHAIGSW